MQRPPPKRRTRAFPMPLSISELPNIKQLSPLIGETDRFIRGHGRHRESIDLNSPPHTPPPSASSGNGEWYLLDFGWPGAGARTRQTRWSAAEVAVNAVKVALAAYVMLSMTYCSVWLLEWLHSRPFLSKGHSAHGTCMCTTSFSVSQGLTLF